MVGKKFGKLTVLSFAGRNKRRDLLYTCKCDCGSDNKDYVKFRLTSGKTKSCGCIKSGVEIKDISGKKYNMLTVIKYIGQDKHRISLWECKCECGNITTVRKNVLNVQISCGCHNIDVRRSTFGDKHPSWNSELTDEDREARRFFKGYTEWCFDIKKKYNFKCFVCNDSRGGNLVSHHIESYHANKTLRLDLDNGVCLCDKCHIKFHKKFGYRNNTNEQFKQFVNEQLESN